MKYGFKAALLAIFLVCICVVASSLLAAPVPARSLQREYGRLLKCYQAIYPSSGLFVRSLSKKGGEPPLVVLDPLPPANAKLRGFYVFDTEKVSYFKAPAPVKLDSEEKSESYLARFALPGTQKTFYLLITPMREMNLKLVPYLYPDSVAEPGGQDKKRYTPTNAVNVALNPANGVGDQALNTFRDRLDNIMDFAVKIMLGDQRPPFPEDLKTKLTGLATNIAACARSFDPALAAMAKSRLGTLTKFGIEPLNLDKAQAPPKNHE